MPIFALEYDDGTIEPFMPDVWPVKAIASVAFDSADTPDEFGLKYTPTEPQRIPVLCVSMRPTTGTAGNTYDVVGYDSADNVIAGPITVDCDVNAVANVDKLQIIRFDSDVLLDAGSTYRFVVKAGSPTILVRCWRMDFDSEALLLSIARTANVCATQRTDAGAWTDFDNVTDGFALPKVYLYVTALDDGAGGGGGGAIALMSSPMELRPIPVAY
jgi:hypothetical protein